MNIEGKAWRTVWQEPGDPGTVHIIDQRALPFALVTERLSTVKAVALAIRDMHVRGAGCIGATAAYGMALAAREATAGGRLDGALLADLAGQLVRTRPTAVNLSWAVQRMLRELGGLTDPDEIRAAASIAAQAIADEDVAACAEIGRHGLALLREIAARKKPGEPVNVLTHCNAGWLAFVDHGSATAPVYAAQDAGVPVHVWVDETRPRNQGARLTAWELGRHGVPHTLIADNAGGHLMQHGQVDMVITGADRVTRRGDVANKIGTYLKALAARDNGVPFYVALPVSTLDPDTADGLSEIPIEERDGDEVRIMSGWPACGGRGAGPDGEDGVRICPAGTPVANPAFDVTPARLVTGLITERGVLPACEDAIGAAMGWLVGS